MNPLMAHMGMGNNNPMLHIIQMLKSGNPEQIAMQLMQRNPQFRQFMDANRGKTPEQVAQENGFDFEEIKKMM